MANDWRIAREKEKEEEQDARMRAGLPAEDPNEEPPENTSPLSPLEDGLFESPFTIWLVLALNLAHRFTFTGMPRRSLRRKSLPSGRESTIFGKALRP